MLAVLSYVAFLIMLSLDYIVLNIRINNELEGMWKEAGRLPIWPLHSVLPVLFVEARSGAVG